VTLVVLLLLAVASWLLRIAAIVIFPASRFPAKLRAALDHLVPAVLASIVAVHLSETLRTPSAVALPVTAAAAGMLAVVAWRTRNVLLTTGLAVAVVAVLDLVVAG
jgi:branched-subunit amino acid transport protein